MATYNGIITSGLTLNSGDIAINVTLISGNIQVNPGGYADTTTVDYGGSMHANGGTVNSTTINYGGNMYVNSGSANNTDVYSGGRITVNDSGSANSTTIYSGGSMYVRYHSGSANNTTAKAGGIINGFSLQTDNFYSEGIHISNAIVSGSAILYSGQTANNTAIYYGGNMSVFSGSVNNTTIYSGGSMTLNYSGSANYTTISGGIMYVQSGTINNTTIYSGGGMNISNSIANCTTVYSGGTISFRYTGSANSTTIYSGGSMLFYSSDTAKNTTISGGYMVVGYGTANSTTILSGGRIDVHSSGTANNTTVYSGGSMILYGSANNTTIRSGGSLRVIDSITDLVVMDGGYVDFSLYSELNLNLSEKTASSDYLIAGTVTGTPSYTITVSENQTAGTYKLVRKLPEFIASVTLNTEGGSIRTLNTNGASVSHNGNRYSLVYEDSSLSLVVTETYTPQADTEAPTSPGNLSITVSADSAKLRWTPASDNIAVTGYRLVLDNGNAINLGSVLSYTIQNPSAGNHTVRLAAYDAAGNIGNYTSATFLVESTTPEPTPTPDPDPTPMPEPGLPAAPDGAAVAVKKYNAKFFWNKYSAEKGVKVKYQIMVDGTVQGKLSSGNSYTLKNAGVGNHAFAVRAVLSEKGRENVYTAWSGNVVQYVADVTAPKTGKLALAQTGEDSLRAEWSAANDNVGIARYVVTCGGVTREFDGSVLSAGFSGLAGKVTAEITAYDAAGNAGKTVRKNLKMNDMTAPDQVTGLRSEGVDNKSGGILAWNAASDNVGVTQYEIAIDGGKTFKSKTNSVKIKKMAAGTYRYTVVALDKAKNRSIVSQEGEFTVADVINPKIRKLSCKVNGQTAFVSWNATDEVGIARSELWLDGARYADTTGLTSFSLGSLELGQHSVELKVWDAAGNDVFKAAKCNVTTPDQGLMTAAETSLFRGDVSRNSGMIASL